MNNSTFDRTSLRLSATLLLVGQILYVVITLLHTGGEANNHRAIFAGYASSQMWTAVHAAQFACMAILLAGLLALFYTLELLKKMTGASLGFLTIKDHVEALRSDIDVQIADAWNWINRQRTHPI